MNKFFGFIIGIAALLIICNVISAALALFLYLAWHYVAVPVFHAPALTFFHVWLGVGALCVLASIFRKNK